MRPLEPFSFFHGMVCPNCRHKGIRILIRRRACIFYDDVFGECPNCGEMAGGNGPFGVDIITRHFPKCQHRDEGAKFPLTRGKSLGAGEGRESCYLAGGGSEQKGKPEDTEKRMTEEVKLKPCPGCGGKAVCSNRDTRFYGVFCASDDKECFCETTGHTTREDAIAAWNNRPLEDAKDARIAELEKQVKELEGMLSGYAKADADMNEALNSGDGSYKP